MAKNDLSGAISEKERLERQQETQAWFLNLRNRICASFEAIEKDYCKENRLEAAIFEHKEWTRPEGGGGTMAIMKGQVFEKVGVNISTVHGEFNPEFKDQIPGTKNNAGFWASGISLVAHMQNPFVPAVHMNTRYINTGGKRWFGGGTDLTPIMPNKAPNKDDAADFHAALKKYCDKHNADYYPRFKAWCDEYFYLKHRGEPRGAGGIFYDYLDAGDYSAEFAFTKDVGEAFLAIYPEIVRRNMNSKFTENDRHQQLIKRGRYVEFNLLYDRGTSFGLKTGGNVEAILMSLPPEVRWN